jgi:hypothetical protein
MAQGFHQPGDVENRLDTIWAKSRVRSDHKPQFCGACPHRLRDTLQLIAWNPQRSAKRNARVEICGGNSGL